MPLPLVVRRAPMFGGGMPCRAAGVSNKIHFGIADCDSRPWLVPPWAAAAVPLPTAAAGQTRSAAARNLIGPMLIAVQRGSAPSGGVRPAVPLGTRRRHRRPAPLPGGSAT